MSVNINVFKYSASLPNDDKEMQRELMKRVLQTLLKVKKLTPKQEAQVQDSLVSIRSGVTDTSMRPEPDHSRYARRLSLIAA
jgi:hypothetical protein